MEEETNKKNDKLKNVIGKYTGKILKAEGTSSKGKSWKKYQMIIKTLQDNEVKINAFDSVGASGKGKELKDLIDGQLYKIVYKEEPYQIPEGDLIKLKTAVIIYSADEKTGNEIKETVPGVNLKELGQKPIQSFEGVEQPELLMTAFEESAWNGFQQNETVKNVYTWMGYACGSIIGMNEDRARRIFNKLSK